MLIRGNSENSLRSFPSGTHRLIRDGGRERPRVPSKTESQAAGKGELVFLAVAERVTDVVVGEADLERNGFGQAADES